MDKLTRRMVVSTPSNTKAGFHKTVILVRADCPKRGTIGICLNRPWSCDCGECPAPHFPTLLGGPEGIDQTYFLIHNLPDIARKKDIVFDGVFMSHPSVLNGKKVLPKKDRENVRVVNGFCHWEPGELMDEVNKKWWLVDSPNPDMILQCPPPLMWRELTPGYYAFQPSEN